MKLDYQKALLYLGYAACLSDGELSEKELNRFEISLREEGVSDFTYKLFLHQVQDKDQNYLLKYGNIFFNRLEEMDQRGVAFYVRAITAADGRITREESKLLVDIRDRIKVEA